MTPTNTRSKPTEYEVSVKCKVCGGEAEVFLDDNGACGDPECCGERSYYIAYKCKDEKCKNPRETIYV